MSGIRSLACAIALVGWVAVASGENWAKQAAADARQDVTAVVFDGTSPNRLVCDVILRAMPDGSWIYLFMGGGDREPLPENYIAITRSTDEGRTWSPVSIFDSGVPREGETIAQSPTELMIVDGRCTLFFATHGDPSWGASWKSWYITSDDSGKTWSKPTRLAGRLSNRTFVRQHIVARDGRIILPFQHYHPAPPPSPTTSPTDPPRPPRSAVNPRNGVLISTDRGRTWTEHGDVRLSDNDRYRGWAENTIAELSDGRILMLIRADKLGGVLYSAVSTDGGVTWPAFASPTTIPNPGSKVRLFPLGGDTVALVHNPDPQFRLPLALWISFDGLKTWPYQRVLVAESCDGPRGSVHYPDGFVSPDKQWLHVVFDNNRHQAGYVRAKLPPLSSVEGP